jgi:aerobic-type carbon monoxide dehydrogenase small subunit (CoxS/CutS family)
MTVAKEQTIRLNVNGVAYERSVEVRRLLVDFLRHDLHLTGTHVGCEHGVCGACTIRMNGESVRSCLLFAVQAEGAELETVEGLDVQGELNPLQQAFWEHHGLQCGFCTPGFLMTAGELVERGEEVSELEIREVLSGNLCRCTGYQTIVEAVQDAVRKHEGGRGKGAR